MFFFWWVALYWNHNFSLSYLTIIFLIKRLFTSYCLVCLGSMQQWSQRQTQSLSATIICFNMFRLFYTGEQETIKGFSRLQTQTGTEMLLVPHQRSPSEGKVRCFYTVQYADVNSPSSHSNTIFVSVRSDRQFLISV